jgi:hypothetical protein
MSEQVAGINGPIAQVNEAIRRRNRTNLSQGLSSLLQGVTMAASTMAASRAGAYPTSGSGLGAGSPNSDIAGALDTLSAVSGGRPIPGALPGTPTTAGSAGGAAQCDVCMIIDRGGFSSVADAYYVFETTVRYSNGPAQCGGRARARIYESLPVSGDPDEQQQGVEGFIRAASVGGRSVRKLCGPCGGAQRAAGIMRGRCPNPSHDIKQGMGGATVNGVPLPR